MPEDKKEFDEYQEVVSLIEKYVAFSGEFLRISLLGIALLGFFVEKVSSAEQFTKSSRSAMLLAIGVAALCFAVSTGASLAHRYYSTETLHHWYNLELINRGCSVVVLPILDRLRWFLSHFKIFPLPLNNTKSHYDSCYTLSGYCLGTAVTFAALGTLFVITCGFLAWWGYVPK